METKTQRKVLLVDDDPDLLRILSLRLRRHGYDVQAAGSGPHALLALPCFRPHVVVTDQCMDGMDGLALFDALRSREPALPVIMLTAHGTIPGAVDATRRGFFAYLTKPLDKQQLIRTLEQASSCFGADDAFPAADAEWRKEIVTQSPAMRQLLRDTWMVAQTDANVLILGESGTGKELLARAIHRASPRRDKPLVPVNSSAIPDQLLEAELFGHRKGAFTGATQARNGLIRAAHGGTLFLDEIGDMPIQLQAKLLRTLENHEVRPVGGTESVNVDVRVISATHQRLETAIAQKRFREDLYYRLNVVTLEIPPLAERRQDIPLLVDRFLAQASAPRERAAGARRFSADAMELLLAADWPGNIRQLRNVVEQCVALATARVIPASHVERALQRNATKAFLPFSEARARFEVEYLATLLAMTQGHVSQAARLAGRNRSQFYKLLHKHALDPERFRLDHEQGGEDTGRPASGPVVGADVRAVRPADAASSRRARARRAARTRSAPRPACRGRETTS